jgi:glucose/arabinose dehydrogenase
VSKPGMEEPTYYWAPSTAPSGLVWYNANLFPEWKGSLLVGMLRGNSLERLKIVDNKVVNEEPLLTEVHMRIRDVRVGPDGAVYVLTDGGLSSITDNTQANSKLLKLTPQ